jgi:hypothetical protein
VENNFCFKIIKQIEEYLCGPIHIWVCLRYYQCVHWCCVIATSFEILGSEWTQSKSLAASSLLRFDRKIAIFHQLGWNYYITKSVGSRACPPPGWLRRRPPGAKSASPVENPRTKCSTLPYIFQFSVPSNNRISGDANPRTETLVPLNAG